MDQQRFEDQVMRDLAGDDRRPSAEERLEDDDALEDEGFETAAADDTADSAEGESQEDPHAGDEPDDGFEEALAEEFGTDEGEAWEALEDAMAESLDAEDPDVFFSRVLGGLGRIAGLVGRGTSAGGHASSATGRRAAQVGRTAGGPSHTRNPIGQLLQRFGQYLNDGLDDIDAFEDMAALYADEGLDEALPVLAGMAARSLLGPAMRGTATRLSRPLRRQLVGSAREAARMLCRDHGRQAVRALPRLAQSIARTATERRLRPAGLPPLVRRTVAEVAARPALVRRLSRSGATTTRGAGSWHRIPQRMVLRGPVEITILSR